MFIENGVPRWAHAAYKHLGLECTRLIEDAAFTLGVILHIHRFVERPMFLFPAKITGYKTYKDVILAGKKLHTMHTYHVCIILDKPLVM